MSENYPKWVSRGQDIGKVLVQSEAEEKQLLNDWDTERLELAEAQTAAAKQVAQAAEDEAKSLVLKTKNK